MRKLQLLILTFSLAMVTNSYGLSFEDDFTVVFIDSETESVFGPFPFDRAILTRGVESIGKSGAKGIVFKFFIDQAKDNDSDDQLASSFKTIPTILQARIAYQEIPLREAESNHFPKRFTLELDAATDIVGESGWIPHPKFSAVAHDICFADFKGVPLSMLGRYQNQLTKSLFLCSIEMALGKKAVISPQDKVDIGGLTLPLDADNHVMTSLELKPVDRYIPFHALIDGTVDRDELRNKVVILAYDGSGIPVIETQAGSLGLHRYFIVLLKALYETGA